MECRNRLAVDLRQRAQAEEHGDDADRLRDKLVSLEEPDLVKLSSCLFRFKSIVAKMKIIIAERSRETATASCKQRPFFFAFMRKIGQ